MIMAQIRQLFSKYINKPLYFTTSNIRQLSTTINENDLPVTDLQNPYEKEQVKCILCKHNIKPNYKNVQLLSQFQSPYTGRIYGKHITGLCTNQQQLVEKEIIRAQSCGLMPYYNKLEEYLDDPKLFDPEKPIRQHKY